MLELFPPGITFRVKILLFLDDGPKSLKEFKEAFSENWREVSQYLYEALTSGLVTLRVQHVVSTNNGQVYVDSWPDRNVPDNELRNIVLMIMSPKKIETSVKDSEVFFYLSDKGLDFLVDYHSKEYWKWGTVMSIIIALISLLVSLVH